jgi:hypothetical protein
MAGAQERDEKLCDFYRCEARALLFSVLSQVIQRIIVTTHKPATLLQPPMVQQQLLLLPDCYPTLHQHVPRDPGRAYFGVHNVIEVCVTMPAANPHYGDQT